MSSIAISNGEDLHLNYSKSEGKEANPGKTLALSTLRLQGNILQLISCFSLRYNRTVMVSKWISK